MRLCLEEMKQDQRIIITIDYHWLPCCLPNLWAFTIACYDTVIIEERESTVKNVLRPKIGDYFSGGLMEHGLFCPSISHTHP